MEPAPRAPGARSSFQAESASAPLRSALSPRTSLGRSTAARMGLRCAPCATYKILPRGRWEEDSDLAPRGSPESPAAASGGPALSPDHVFALKRAGR